MRPALFPTKNCLVLLAAAVFAAQFSYSAHPAFAAWPLNGVAIAVAPKNQIYPIAVTDGSGGSIIVWQDSRTPPGPYYSFDIYAQRISGNGVPLWDNNGKAVCTWSASDNNAVAVPDGFGGAIIAWQQTTQDGFFLWDIYAQRIDGSGNPIWPVNGIKLNTQNGFQSEPCLTSDGLGGAIVAWYDNGDIWARRITSDGSSPWTGAAIPVCQKPLTQEADPSITTDGAGGAIVCWSDSTEFSTRPDIYAQRVSNNGTLIWPLAGVRVCNAIGIQTEATAFDDGAGGAVFVWRDLRSSPDADLFMQRIDGSGARQWALNGLVLCDAPGSQGLAVSVRQGNRFIVAWEDTRDNSDIYAQQCGLNGISYWANNGIPVIETHDSQYSAQIAGDGKGGAIVGWMDHRGVDDDIYAQHLDTTGSRLWNPTGVIVVNASQTQIIGRMTSDGQGGAFLPWADFRDGEPDVYVGRIGAYGTISGVSAAPDATLSLHTHPNPFSETTEIDFDLPTTSDVRIELFDARGSRVRSQFLPARRAGWHRTSISTQDGQHLLASGVYFLKVSAAGGATASRKIIVAH